MLNKVILMGRFAADPELRHTQSGTPVCSFRLAVERDFKDKDGSRQTDWLDCVAWKGTAEFISRYFSKGRMAVVDGRLQTRSYEDKNGSKRKAVEVVADSVYFADSKRTESANPTEDNMYMPPEVERPAGDEPPGYSDDSELPF